MMFNVRKFAGDGAEEATMGAQAYEVVDTGPNVSIRVWDTIMKDRAPIGQWGGARRSGSNPGESVVLISNKFGHPLETIYFLP